MSFSRSSIFFSLVLLAIVWPTVPLAAEEGYTPLDVEVRVPDQSRKVRDAAFTSGLQRVLVRLSGDSQVLGKLDLPPAGRYVKQFRYDNIENHAAETRAGGLAQLKLWIQYDEERLVTFMRESGIPVWSSRRDPVVIWFAVRDGMNHYLLRDDDESQLKDAVLTAAAARALPLRWPRYDATDRGRVLFADVWGGFASVLRKASSRYSTGPVVAANMAWNGSRWVGEWYLIDSGLESYWQLENSDYANLISQGLDRVSDTLGTRYAILDDVKISDASHLRVIFQDVGSVQAYKYVTAMLKQNPSVKLAQPWRVAPDSAGFDVYLRSEESDFLDRMKRNPELRQLMQPVEVPQQPISQPQSQADRDADPQGDGAMQAPLPGRVVPEYRFQFLGTRR